MANEITFCGIDHAICDHVCGCGSPFVLGHLCVYFTLRTLLWFRTTLYVTVCVVVATDSFCLLLHVAMFV